MHRIASHRIASHRIASHRIASHRIASHRIASHRIASHRIASHRIAPHCVIVFRSTSSKRRSSLVCHPCEPCQAPADPCDSADICATPSIAASSYRSAPASAASSYRSAPVSTSRYRNPSVAPHPSGASALPSYRYVSDQSSNGTSAYSQERVIARSSNPAAHSFPSAASPSTYTAASHRSMGGAASRRSMGGPSRLSNSVSRGSAQRGSFASAASRRSSIACSRRSRHNNAASNMEMECQVRTHRGRN